MRTRSIPRLTIEHLLVVVAEWLAIIGVLTYAYGRGGARTTGLASLAMLAPHVVGAPVVARLLHRHRALAVRRVAFAVEAVLFAAAGIVALVDGPLVVVVGAAAVAVGAIDVLRPSGAMLLPWASQTSADLIRGNLWSSYAESASALVGPLLAAGLAQVSDGAAPLAGCAVLTAVALAVSLASAGPGPDVDRRTPDDPAPRVSLIGRIRARPWTLGVYTVATARHFALAAFDVLVVVLAYRSFDLDASGPGLLSAVMGTGAIASAAAITLISRRRRLGPVLLLALALASVACFALAATSSKPAAYVALGVLGLTASLVNNLSRMMLQRSADPVALGTMFAGLGLAGGVGDIVGAMTAQLLVAVAGVETAVAGVGAVLAVVALATVRALRIADLRSDVPVVEMSLLREVPLFAPLPPIALEMLGREAGTMQLEVGDHLIRQGDQGDAFFVVIRGAFVVEIDGVPVRPVGRGEGVGEVALLADVPRTASIIATEPGEVLVVHRDTFLGAVTGHRPAFDAARSMVNGRRFAAGAPPEIVARPRTGP